MYSRVDFGFDYNYDAFDSGLYPNNTRLDFTYLLVGARNDIGVSLRLHSVDKSLYRHFANEEIKTGCYFDLSVFVDD